MIFRFQRTDVIAVCFAVMFLIAYSSDIAFSDETRHCRGWYEVKVTHINGRPAPANIMSIQVANFTSKGMCRNRLSANECRRNARDFAHKCMKTHWAVRNSKSIPKECEPIHNGTGVRDYSVWNLRKQIEMAACGSLHSYEFIGNKAQVIYSIYSVTNGNRGCGPNLKKSMSRKIGEGYNIICNK